MRRCRRRRASAGPRPGGHERVPQRRGAAAQRPHRTDIRRARPGGRGHPDGRLVARRGMRCQRRVGGAVDRTAHTDPARERDRAVVAERHVGRMLECRPRDAAVRPAAEWAEPLADDRVGATEGTSQVHDAGVVAHRANAADVLQQAAAATDQPIRATERGHGAHRIPAGHGGHAVGARRVQWIARQHGDLGAVDSRAGQELEQAGQDRLVTSIPVSVVAGDDEPQGRLGLA